MTDLAPLLDAVRSDGVEFATMRPPGSPFTTLDRRVVVTAPPQLADLASIGDTDVLDALVDLLRDPETAWAAAVVLAAMTRREEKEVEAFAAQPQAWWEALGADAHERWRDWLDDARDRLHWDPDIRAFVERP